MFWIAKNVDNIAELHTSTSSLLDIFGPKVFDINRVD